MQEIAFDPAVPRASLELLPERAAVFALLGADERAEPYIGRTPNLRARLTRLLTPSARHPKRLQLAGLVKTIQWRPVGSEFEALLAQFALLEARYGAKALERMHLRAPYFLRYFGAHRYPFVSVTFRPVARESQWAYGPFPSRAAAERFAEESLKLFGLRRCSGDIWPDPNYAGCVYSEMKKCLAPCNLGCTDERYAEEARAFQSYLETRGLSRLEPLRAAREEASAELAFERAAEAHAQAQRVESACALLPDLARPLDRLRAVLVQAAAEAGQAAIFLFDQGYFRAPLLLTAVAGASDEPGEATEGAGEDRSAYALRKERRLQEEQLEASLAALAQTAEPPSATARQAHLALLKRWHYRPESRRQGEIFFPDAEGRWPARAILRAAVRLAAGAALSPAD